MWFIKECNDGGATAASWESDVTSFLNFFLTKSYEHSMLLSEHSPSFPGTVDNSFQAARPPVSSRWQKIPKQVSGNHGCADNTYKSCVFI